MRYLEKRDICQLVFQTLHYFHYYFLHNFPILSGQYGQIRSFRFRIKIIVIRTRPITVVFIKICRTD